jgi:serine/threonine-protein kinase
MQPMLVGQQVGPFAIDKELGSGAMGTVYRGVYAKTGQRVAIKVMLPGMGTKDSSGARFDREAAILKQFNHPNIVRLFGVGRHHGMRYYAMEYIDGEALDRVLARRGKLTWEEVVDFGMQLCAALQHAHEAGVIHRDLKPSNLMILKDGKTLKLTDFGIAKDTDVTQLTSANCTVGTAAYMSPEQCRGERDLTAKSDLYSLGIVFYELLTGRKPFEAENAMEMFLKHVNEAAKRPIHQPGCLDIPSWLDTLVNQLMEKKPEQRPLNAAMIYSVLESIRDKVEHQQSAGVDAAKKKLLDTPRAERATISEEDREAARTLLGGKGRLKKKRRSRTGFFGSVWFQAFAVAALLAGIGTALWLVFRPPPPEKLYEQAKKLMEKDSLDEWNRAVEDRGPITLYLKHHGDRPGKETEQVRAWQKKIEDAQVERLLERYVSNRRSGAALKVQTQNEAEEAAFKAMWAEAEGDLDDARRRWDKIKDKYGPGSGFTAWSRIAEQHIRNITGAQDREQAMKGQWNALVREHTEPELEGPEKGAFTAYRAQQLGDVALARKVLSALKDTKDPVWATYAAVKLRELKDRKEVDRKDLVKDKLAEAEGLFMKDHKLDDLLVAAATCADIAALYENDAELKDLVKQAAALRDRLVKTWVEARQSNRP